jgi:hypothetical protein
MARVVGLVTGPIVVVPAMGAGVVALEQSKTLESI